jgi:micrococcal nuclease
MVPGVMNRAMAAVAGLSLVACGSVPPDASDAATPTAVPEFGHGPQTAVVRGRVVDIIDGDTIKVRIGGAVYSLRYIGIDAPERGAPGARAATAANRQLVDGETVLLEADVSDTDRFDRLLRYVWLADGAGLLLVNRELVRIGVAIAKAYPPDTSYQRLLNAAERRAKEREVGLWNDSPAPLVPLVPQAPSPKPGRDCDRSYPDVCIPPYPPDLDCGEIPHRYFTVRPPDPHGFDAEGDGVGCEME